MCKWIKATESDKLNLPVNTGQIFWREIDSQLCGFTFLKGKGFISPFGEINDNYSVIEWLDESDQFTQPVGIEVEDGCCTWFEVLVDAVSEYLEDDGSHDEKLKADIIRIVKESQSTPVSNEAIEKEIGFAAAKYAKVEDGQGSGTNATKFNAFVAGCEFMQSLPQSNEASRTPEKSYREQMGYSKELERLEDMLGERIGFLEDQVLMHTFLAWQDERNNIFDSLPKHTPEVKGYSREQMREYLVEFMSCHSMKSKAHLERLVDDFISSLPPSTGELNK